MSERPPLQRITYDPPKPPSATHHAPTLAGAEDKETKYACANLDLSFFNFSRDLRRGWAEPRHQGRRPWGLPEGRAPPGSAPNQLQGRLELVRGEAPPSEKTPGRGYCYVSYPFNARAMQCNDNCLSIDLLLSEFPEFCS